ncbi:hypothetical protein ACIQZO_05800 [Streptomyces sp. NPDC097617]|uniref:hypothetical protein n=1 Tax=Streptomyces sp. NPDC097617 TaxID=3366091 RepID=UPI0037FE6329
MQSIEFGTSQAERLERLRAQLQGRQAVADSAPRAQASQGSALLFGVMLHAASRLDAGLELTEVEERLVRPLQLLLDEEEVKAFGRMYREETAAGATAAVLPGSLAGREVTQGYATADLLKDLSRVRDEVLAQPNVSIVDVNSAPAGVDGTFDSEEFNAGQAAYGYGATVVTSSAPPPEDPGALASFIARVDMFSFLCERESDEWSASDEIYWGMSSAGAFGNRQERLTYRVTNVDRGEWHDFPANTTLYNGRVDAALVCNISCWEEDDGSAEWMNQLRNKLVAIGQELMTFVDLMTNIAIIIPEYGDMLDYATLAAGFAYLIAKLIDLFRNPDDLVQQRSLVFDQAALRQLVTHGGAGSTGWVFDGGNEGRHRLQLKWIGNPPPTDAPGDIKVLAPANSQWGATTRLTGATDCEPALAVLDGKPHLAVRGMSDGTYHARFNGSAWSGYTQVPNHVSLTAPALAEHQGRLYLGTCGTNGDLYVTPYDGNSWGQAAKLKGRSSASPALAVRNGTLHCAIRGRDADDQVYLAWLTNTGWTDFQTVPGLKTAKAPALASHQGKLYLAAAALDGKIHVAVHDGSGWATSPMQLGGTSDSSPALTVRNGILYCAMRTLDSRIALNSYNGNTWTGWTQQVPDAATMSGPALAGGSGDTLHIAYRTA